jgi:prepilin-type N-terminal cleavage/methylation domain-containing protein
MRKKKLKFKKGFSLIEVLVAIFIFSFVMTMIAGSFSSFFKSYIAERKTQTDIENAQYAMNIMAKALRTSEVESTSSFPLNTFDYSQSKCIRYDISSSAVVEGITNDTSPEKLSDCNFGSLTYYSLTNNDIKNASVSATATSVPTLGKVTVSLGVQDQSKTTSLIPIQMSVSLRQ